MRILGLIAVLVAAAMGMACANTSDSDPRATVERTVEVDGLTVSYEASGQGPTTVLLVHGAFGHGDFWDAQRDALRGHHRVVVLDLPGHGASDAPAIDYTRELMVKAMAVVAEDAEASNLVVVGHSLGALLARDFYLEHPDRVTGVVLVDGLLIPLVDERLRDAVIEPFRGDGFRDAANSFIDQFMFAERTPQHVRARVRSQMLATPQHVWVSILETATDPAIRSTEPIEVPTLGVYTQSDAIPEGYEDFLRETFRDLDYRTVPEGTGHYVMLERPTELSNQLIDFAAEVL